MCAINEERIKRVLTFQTSGYDDICLYKKKILKDILSDTDILEILNNPHLDLSTPEEFYNINIFDRLKIPSTDAQSIAKNFICFELDDIESIFENKCMINKQLTFRIISPEKDVETPYGLNRHDLISALIKERFCWSNILGNRLEKVSDTGRVAESEYYYRDIKFQTITTNTLSNAQTKNLLDSNRSKYDRRI